MPASLVHLVVETALQMASREAKAKRWRKACAHTRDALWFLLAFMACLRRSEAVRVRADEITPGVVKGTWHLFIPFSKTDQEGVGNTLPVPTCSDTGLNLAKVMAAHRAMMRMCGMKAEAHLFGQQRNPLRPLTSAQTILRRLRVTYFPQLALRGLAIPDHVRFAGHSFRRGGINAIRDGARAAGLDDAALRTQLMRFGRWVSEESLLLYLRDNWEQLAALSQRM